MRANWKKISKQKTIFFSHNHEYLIYFKLLLQTNYLTKTLEILIQKTSNNMLQEEKKKESESWLWEAHHQFRISQSQSKTLYLISAKWKQNAEWSMSCDLHPTALCRFCLAYMLLVLINVKKNLYYLTNPITTCGQATL